MFFYCFLVWLQNTNYVLPSIKSWLVSHLLHVPLNPLNPVKREGKIENMVINISLVYWVQQTISHFILLVVP